MTDALQGKVGLVTGGSSGIGMASVQALTSAGVSCAIADLHPPPAGVGELFIEADVADPAAWPTIVEQTEARFGGIDIAHLNAGVMGSVGPFEEISDAQYQRIMRINVDGVFYGVRALVPAMERRGGGAIVCTASIAGLMGTPPDPVYAMSKHAVVGLVRSMGQLLFDRGISLNAINPGFADTPMLAQAKEAFDRSGFPLLAADEVAGAVLLALTSGRSGECWIVQPGRDPMPYGFRGIPGPRVPGKEGATPPDAWG